MAASIYERGDRVRCSAQFADDAGVPTNPDTVTFRMAPLGKPVVEYVYPSPEIVNTGPGAYYVDWTTATIGAHTYTFLGTGKVQRTLSASFRVVAVIP